MIFVFSSCSLSDDAIGHPTACCCARVSLVHSAGIMSSLRSLEYAPACSNMTHHARHVFSICSRFNLCCDCFSDLLDLTLKMTDTLPNQSGGSHRTGTHRGAVPHIRFSWDPSLCASACVFACLLCRHEHQLSMRTPNSKWPHLIYIIPFAVRPPHLSVQYYSRATDSSALFVHACIRSGPSCVHSSVDFKNADVAIIMPLTTSQSTSARFA